MALELHEAKSVIPTDDYHLIVEFEDKTVDYDMTELFESFPVFQRLKEDDNLYKSVYVDLGGYGLVWNDDIDVSTHTIWHNGKTLETHEVVKQEEKEEVKYVFHTAKSVVPTDDYHLIVEFEDKTVDYDMTELFERFPVFQKLKEDKDLYKSVKPSPGGYGLIWNDDIDVSSNHVWYTGTTISTQQ